MTQAKKQKSKKDPLLPIKNIAYSWSQLPPTDDCEFDDFVAYAKFRLCIKTNTLIKDDIWDKYTDEEILVEYYAHVFNTSEKERSTFLAAISSTTGELDSICDWLDKMVDQNQKDNANLPEFKDHISFKPESLGEN